jgi:hypothetical protein
METTTFNSYLKENTCDHYKDQVAGLRSCQPENSVHKIKHNITYHHYKDKLVGLTSQQPKNSVPTSKKTQCVTTTKINWLMTLHQENAFSL